MVSALFESDAKRFARTARDARGYHFRALQFAAERKRASLIFNVASIAIENYLIALCAYHNVMPSNHNYSNLLADARSVMPFEPELAASIEALDEIFGICSLEHYHHGEPSGDDSSRSLATCDGLLRMLQTLEKTPLTH